MALLQKVAPIFDGKRYDIPPPSLCPACRQQRRCAFRNERKLYHRKCDGTGRQMISIYSPDKPFTIYDQEYWWGDEWDPRDFEREYDFSRPFFEQFRELQLRVPRVSLFTLNAENSEYTNHGVYNKDCYMCFNTGYCQNTLYSGGFMIKSTDCCDCTNVKESELLHSCIDCETCYHSRDLIQCRNCRDSAFLYDCVGCCDCFLCTNLRQKQYCIENDQLTKEEYEKRMNELDLGSHTQYSMIQKRFDELIRSHAYHQALRQRNSEGCIGNFINGSQNAYWSFDILDSQDLRYCYDAWNNKDCMDTYQSMDKAELQYEGHASSTSVQAAFCNISHENNDIYYTDLCFNSHHLFGCVGMKRSEYCILNKQYSKEEYEELVPRIIEHMMETKEYGEFFPVELSPCAYNETLAQEYFPLSKEDAVKREWQWFDEEEKQSQYMGPPYEIPDSIADIDDEICDHILSCQETGRPFKLIAQELKYYREHGIPIPRLCPDERHRQRLRKRNPRTLFSRECAKCNAKIFSTYDPQKPEIVFCESCYLNATQ